MKRPGLLAADDGVLGIDCVALLISSMPGDPGDSEYAVYAVCGDGLLRRDRRKYGEAGVGWYWLCNAECA
jgi:hypothetical protein